MKAYTEGLRALILFAVSCMDRESISTDDAEKRKWQHIMGLLTPVSKAYTTDKAFEVCALAIQVLGGYGYTKEYKVEQFARDCKITSIYEGTNGIQAIDLFGRKIRMENGAALAAVLAEMKAAVAEAIGVGELAPYAEEVGKSICALEEISKFLIERCAGDDAYLTSSWATPYLEIFGDIALGWMFIWQAKKACDNKATNSADAQFYDSKINTAKFYISSLLPRVYGKIEAIKRYDRSFLAMGEAIFVPS
jgi:hypothetical protein